MIEKVIIVNSDNEDLILKNIDKNIKKKDENHSDEAEECDVDFINDYGSEDDENDKEYDEFDYVDET